MEHKIGKYITVKLTKHREVSIMKTVKKTSIFPASKKKVFSRLLKLKTLQYIAYPYATFTPMDGANSMSWEVGSTSRFKFRLFGVIPFGTHTIHVIRFGLDEGIYTHEGNEHVPTWNHEIILEELQGNRCTPCLVWVSGIDILMKSSSVV